MRTVTDAGDDGREAALGVAQREVKGGEATHRESNDVSTIDLEVIEHGQRIRHRPELREGSTVIGNVRRGVATGCVRDALVTPREAGYLRFPAAVIAGELVNEQDRSAVASSHLVMEGNAVIGQGMRHC